MTWRTLSKEARIDLVKEHWCSGYSASDIARSISARHRDKLTNHPLQMPNQPEQARNPKPRRERVSKPRAPKPPKPVETPTVAPQARFVPLLDLRARDCRWPVNDARIGELHLFCGCETKPGSSWCDFHAELVFGQGTESERSAVRQARVAA